MQPCDRLGVYRVGDLKFYSKLEAIEAMQRTGIHLHWDFNEAVFSSYNWAQEPATPILELYRQRAQQLRDQYDYIVLIYSGGADSHTVLEAFVDNDIKLDEVASYVNYDATGDRDNFFNAEIFHVAMPQIDRVRERYPDFQHRIIDFSQLTLDFFEENTNAVDWIYRAGFALSPNGIVKESLGLKVPEWRKIIDQGKRLCLIWGLDKPRMAHINGQFVLRFIDIVDGCPSVKSVAGQQPYSDELFYWTPDLPEMIIKQAHLVKNYLNSHNMQNLPFITTESSGIAYKEIQGQRHWISNHGLHRLIYPKWNIETFTAGKPKSPVFSPRDTWFFNLEDTSIAKNRWQSGVQKIFQSIPDYWKNDPADISRGLKHCWSKDYYIGD